MYSRYMILVICVITQLVIGQNSLDLTDYNNSYTKQMSDGTIWISSLNAINRYDGTEVKVYWPEPSTPYGLKEGLIQSQFIEDDQGDVWFTTVSYLNRWERNTNRFHTYQVDSTAGAYRLIGIESDCVYLQIEDGDIYRMCNEGFELLYSGFLAIEFVLETDDDSNIKHLYGTRWSYGPGLLHLYSTDDGYQCDTLFTDLVTYRTKATSDENYIVGNNGILGIQEEYFTEIGSENVDDATASETTLYYLKSDSLMAYKDGMSILKYRVKPKYDRVVSISDILFTGNVIDKSYELFSTNDNPWQFYNSESAVFKVRQFDDHVTWTMSDGDVIKKIDSRIESHSTQLLDDPIVVFNAQNKSLVVSNHGAIEESTLLSLSMPGPIMEYVRGGTVDSNNNLIISHINGIRKISADRKSYKDYRIGTMHNAIFANALGWMFSHADDYIYIINVEALDTDPIIATIPTDLSIHQFYPKDDTTMLIASNKGLYQLDLQTFDLQPWKYQEHYIQTIIYDDKHQLWFATRDGLYKETISGQLTKYSEANGLPSHKFTHDCSLLGDDGTLYFGTSEGILYFYPDDIVEQEYNPPMLLTSLQVHGAEWGGDSINVEVINDVSLDYNENTLTFDFVAVDYNESNVPQYSVYLEGYDSDTIYLHDQSRVTYPNIAPGDYTFYYGACTMSGYCMEEYKQLQVTIRPPYWQTWWFRSVALIGILGFITLGIVLFLRNQLREQRYAYERQELILKTELQLQQERNRIADELHDELGGKLSSIKFASKKVERADNLQDVKHITTRVSEISSELIDSMRSIIWAMDTQNDTYESLTAYIRNYTSNMGRDNDLSIRFEPTTYDIPINIKGQIRHHLSLTIKEIINNIIKHAEASIVEVCTEVVDGTLVVVIQENGKGFDPEDVKATGKGLRSIRKRMESIQGQLTYTRSDGMLTRIEVPLA